MIFTVVKKNIIANFAGSGWTALLGLVLIPVYIRFLGIEAWGVIGIFTSLQTLAYLLDLGLSATLNREMARLSLHQDNAQEMRDLVRTFELIYFGFAVAIGTTVFALAPLIAHQWINSNQLSPDTITNAIRLIGLAIVFQWPFVLYSGGLLGLQRQVLLSGVTASIATIRGVGAALVLWQFSNTLQAFFVWQILVSLLQSCLAGWLLWHSLPHAGRRPSFQGELLRKRWRFAAGMSGIIVVAIIVRQIDKVILSRLLSLEMFGYYVLGSSVATSLYLMAVPLFYAVYPKFTQLVTLDDRDGLKELYHHSCQLMSVVILPISIVVAFFSKEILFLWTGNATTVEHTHLILSILVIGTALTGLMQLPYALQLAHGWTKLAFYLNVVLALMLAPSIVLMVRLYGVAGAAWIWVLLNVGLALVSIQLMHRRLLKGERWRWYFEDVGLPLAVSVGTALLCLLIVPTGGTRIQLLTFLAGATLFVAGSTFLAVPVTRAALLHFFRSWRASVFDAP